MSELIGREVLCYQRIRPGHPTPFLARIAAEVGHHYWEIVFSGSRGEIRKRVNKAACTVLAMN